jgi:regulator of protease activity HflC (stomatin/prohibitin superfamily)
MRPLAKILLISGFVVFIVTPSIILFSVSFSTLDATQIALDYNNNNKQVSSRVYDQPGIYLLGLGHSFIRFPKMLQTISFEKDRQATCFSSDGLPVVLGLSFQYKLVKEELYQLYMEYGPNYLNTFTDVAQNKIGELATNFTAYKFFSDRSEISNDMLRGLQLTFSAYLHANVEYVQLHTVSLPQQFEDAIQDTIVAEQEIIKARYEYQTAEVNATTTVINCQAQANITLINAQGQAAKLLQLAQARANATALLISFEGDGLSVIKNELNLTADLVH